MSSNRNLFDQNHPYQDILHLPHHKSPTRAQMPILDRAAQFSPFAALTGYEAAIEETERLTEAEIELDETVKQQLNQTLNRIKQHEREHPEVRITYFVPDLKKEGGEYDTVQGRIKKIDEYDRCVRFMDGTTVKMEQIKEIYGKTVTNDGDFDLTHFV